MESAVHDLAKPGDLRALPHGEFSCSPESHLLLEIGPERGLLNPPRKQGLQSSRASSVAFSLDATRPLILVELSGIDLQVQLLHSHLESLSAVEPRLRPAPSTGRQSVLEPKSSNDNRTIESSRVLYNLL